jgi:hypothetical protein
LVEHESRMLDSKIPEFSTNLLFCDISPCHPYESLPHRFDKAIGRLSTGRSAMIWLCLLMKCRVAPPINFWSKSA